VKKLLCLALWWSCTSWAGAFPDIPWGSKVSCDVLLPRDRFKSEQQFSAKELAAVQKAAQSDPQTEGLVIGGLHVCGIGVPKDVEKGLDIWKAAAADGKPYAALFVFAFYTGAFGVAPAPPKAIEWLMRGAQNGVVELQTLLGTAYVTGEGVPRDLVEAERWLLKAAAQGSADGQFTLGAFYADSKRYLEAAKWFQLSAVQGNAEAQFHLGNLYSTGAGVKIDAVAAVQWWREAAERKSAMAQLNVGYAYENGRGVQANPAEAIRWYRLAAEQDLAEGMEALARAYELGFGVKRDPALAFQWWKKLAEKQYLPAYLRVGSMYVGGLGVARDAAEGVKWFRAAADQDMPEAYVSLALAFEYGLGIPVDLKQAFSARLKNANRGYRSQYVDSCAFMPGLLQPESDSSAWLSAKERWLIEVLIEHAEKMLSENKPQDALCFYQRAADSGLTKGLVALGNAYLARSAIPANPKLGLHYLRLAAVRGDLSARVRLSRVYREGDAVAKNVVAAYALGFATAFQPDELDGLLENYRPGVEDDMTPEQVWRGRQLIRDMSAPGQYLLALDRVAVE
jgi:TPR repeat protein